MVNADWLPTCGRYQSAIEGASSCNWPPTRQPPGVPPGRPMLGHIMTLGTVTQVLLK